MGKSKCTKILLNYTHPRSMRLELSEIWNFHRHSGKLLVVCFNPWAVSISWPAEWQLWGQPGFMAALPGEWHWSGHTHSSTSPVDLTCPAGSSQSILSYYRGKSTLKCPEQWNTRDLLGETNSTPEALQPCKDRNCREGTVKSQLM